MALVQCVIKRVALLSLLMEKCTGDEAACTSISQDVVAISGQSLLQATRRHFRFGSSSYVGEEAKQERAEPETLDQRRCPQLVPECGTTCTDEGRGCSYGPDGKRNSIFATCQYGSWKIMSSSSTCQPTTIVTTQQIYAVSGTVNPEKDWCPKSIPGCGQGCAREGLRCRYGSGKKFNTTSASCNGGYWEIATGTSSCRPTTTTQQAASTTLATTTFPAPCPESTPKLGEQCAQEGLQCKYGICELPVGDRNFTILATCSNASWKVVVRPTACQSTTTEGSRQTSGSTVATTTTLAQCPDLAPQPGQACTRQGAQCQYGIYACGGDDYYTTLASCKNNSWEIVKAARVICQSGSTTSVASTVVTTTSLSAQCPILVPESGRNCTAEGLQCKYGLHICPLGDSYYTTFAYCNDRKWDIAMAMIECQSSTTNAANQSSTTMNSPSITSHRDCPEFSPEPEERCFSEDLHCKYGLYVCPLGDEYYSTFATCNGSAWKLAIADVVCSSTTAALATPASPTTTTKPATLPHRCPESIPVSGSECSYAGLQCNYFTCSPGEETNRTLALCAESAWTVAILPMTCPDATTNSSNTSQIGSRNASLASPTTTTPVTLPRTCPDSIPESGSECPDAGLQCNYFTCSPGEETNRTLAVCAERVWTVGISPMTCPDTANDSSNTSQSGSRKGSDWDIWTWLRSIFSR